MNPISSLANSLKPFKIVRKPGYVKFAWDKKVIVYLLLAGAILTLVLGFYISLLPTKPDEGYERLLSIWGFLLFAVIGDVVFMAILLKLQGVIHVNQTQSKVEIFKGLGLNTRTHFLPFDTLEKVVLATPTPFLTVSANASSQGLLYEQVGIYLKTGEEIELPFARLVPEEALKVVKEIAEAAGIPAFDREGNPIRFLQSLGSPA